MKTYAEKESATQESGRKSEEDTGARHLGEPDSLNTGWQRLADRIGRDREWDFGLGDAVPQWITLLPGWQESGLLLAVRAGTATHYFPERRTDADVVRVVLRENHYWALVNGGEVKVTDDGNCFFYAVWTVLKEPEHAEAARKIFRGRVPETPQAASDYFRRELRAYALQHPEYAEIFGEGEEDFVAASDSGPRTPEMGEASEPSGSTSGGERDSQSDLGTEVKRTLFHVGSDTAAFVGQAAATTLMHRTLATALPFPLLFSAFGYGTSVFNLLAALRRRNLVEGLMQTLLLLPYHVLSPHNLLFALAEQTKRFIDKEMGGRGEASQGEHTEYLAENIYMTVVLIAFLTHFGYLYGERVEQPGTWIGKLIAAIPRHVNRIVQAYSIVEKIVSAKPQVDLAAIVEPTCDALGYSVADELVLTKAEKQTQKRERAERRANVTVMREGARERLKRPSHDEPTLVASRPEMPAEQVRSPGGTATPQGGLIASLLAGVVGLWAHQGSAGAEMIPLQDVVAQRAGEAVVDGAEVGAHAETALLDGPASVAAANAASHVAASRWSRPRWTGTVVAVAAGALAFLVDLGVPAVVAVTAVVVVAIVIFIWWYAGPTAREPAHGDHGAISASDIANITGDTTAVTSETTTVTIDTGNSTSETTNRTNETQISVEDIVAELSEILTLIEFVDVGEDSEFSALFGNSSGTARRRRAAPGSVAAKPSPDENTVKSFLDGLGSEFPRNSRLYEFFTDLMDKLTPLILEQKAVMARLDDDFAVLIELDEMLIAMQRFIIKDKFQKEDYSNFEALFMINQVRNVLVRFIERRHERLAISYYSILSRRVKFNQVREFWSGQIIETYFKFSMRQRNISDETVNHRLTLLKNLRAEASSLIVHSGENAIGFVGERQMINFLIYSVRSKLREARSNLEVKRGLNDGIRDVVAERSLEREIEGYDELNDLLREMREIAKNRDSVDFGYPVAKPDYVKEDYISTRASEILGGEGGLDQNVRVTHHADNTTEFQTMSVRGIASGLHKRHRFYSEKTKIEWPAVIGEIVQQDLLDIEAELELAEKILTTMKSLGNARTLLIKANFEGITAFIDKKLAQKGKELGVQGVCGLNTTVVHQYTHYGMGRELPSVRVIRSTPTLGQIVVGRLDPPDTRFFASSERLNNLARYAYNEDFQTLYGEKIREWREDAKLREAFDNFSLSKIKPIIISDVKLFRLTYRRVRFAGLYAYVDSSNRFVVISLQTNEKKIFGSKKKLDLELQRKGDIWKWFKKHVIGVAEMETAYGSIYQKPTLVRPSIRLKEVDLSSASYYDDFLDSLFAEADMLVKSASERLWNDLAEAVAKGGLVLLIAAFPLGFLPSLAITVATQTVPAMIIANISDNLEEQDRFLFEAAMSILFTGGGYFVGELLGAGADRAAEIFEKIGASSKSFKTLISRKINIFRGKSIDDINLPRRSNPKIDELAEDLKPLVDRGQPDEPYGPWDEYETVIGTRMVGDREYHILADEVEAAEAAEYEFAYAKIDGKFWHTTTWKKGTADPLAELPEDFILTAHGAREGSHIGGPVGDPANYAENEQVLIPPKRTLVFYTPDTYMLKGRTVNQFAKYLDFVTPFSKVGDEIPGGFERSDILIAGKPPEISAPLDRDKSEYSYVSGIHPDQQVPVDPVRPVVANYKFAYYEDDKLWRAKVGVSENRKIVQTRADIIGIDPSITSASNAVDLKNVMEMMERNFPNYKRLHIWACRELMVDGESIGEPFYYSPKLDIPKAKNKRSLDSSVVKDVSGRLKINALVTIITWNQKARTVVETIQGVILSDSGEYLELNPERGNRLFLAGFDTVSYAASTSEVEDTEKVIDPGKPENIEKRVELNSTVEPVFELFGNENKFGLIRSRAGRDGNITWIAVPDGYEFQSKDVPLSNRTGIARPYANFHVANVQSDVAGFRRYTSEDNEDRRSVITLTRSNVGVGGCDAAPIEALSFGNPGNTSLSNEELCIFSGNSRLDIANQLTANAEHIAANPSSSVSRLEVVVKPNATTPFLSQSEVEELLMLAANSRPAPARVLVLTPRLPLYRTSKRRQYYVGMGDLREFKADKNTYVEKSSRLIRFNVDGIGVIGKGKLSIVDVSFDRSLIIGPYERSKWNRPELWRGGAVLDMFQLTEGAKEICLKTLSPQGEYSFKANRSIENGQVRWRLSGVFSGEAIKDDGPMADGNLFSQFDAEWDELVGDILNSGSVATYSAEYEDGGVIKGTVSEDVFDFDSKSDLYGLDFPVSYNEANVNDDALLDKIKSEDDLIRFAARMLGSRWRQGENTILDIFYLLLSVHRSYLLPGNILNARSLDDLEYLAKNILQSAAFVVASSRLADDAPVQAVRHFSLQAKATFLKKIAEWIIKKYDINLTRIGGESEFDFIRRLTGILAAVKSDQLPRMRVTAAYWVALFSEYVPPAPSSAEAAVRAAPFVEAVTVGQSVIESLIDSTQTIQIRGGINLIYKNEIFYYSPQKNTDLVTVSSTIYGDSTQQNRLGDENGLLNWKKPGAAGRTDDKRPAQNTLVEKETRLRLSNLYHVEARDTLRTIAQKQLGNETYARQIALINIGVNGLVLSGIIKDVDGLKDIGKPLEELVKLDTEIEFDTVLIMPMKVQFAYDLFARRGGADNAYEFLSTRFYLYVSEETKKKLKDWDERKILQAQVKRLQNGDLETFYDYIAPP